MSIFYNNKFRSALWMQNGGGDDPAELANQQQKLIDKGRTLEEISGLNIAQLKSVNMGAPLQAVRAKAEAEARAKVKDGAATTAADLSTVVLKKAAAEVVPEGGASENKAASAPAPEKPLTIADLAAVRLAEMKKRSSTGVVGATPQKKEAVVGESEFERRARERAERAARAARSGGAKSSQADDALDTKPSSTAETVVKRPTTAQTTRQSFVPPAATGKAVTKGGVNSSLLEEEQRKAKEAEARAEAAQKENEALQLEIAALRAAQSQKARPSTAGVARSSSPEKQTMLRSSDDSDIPGKRSPSPAETASMSSKGSSGDLQQQGSAMSGSFTPPPTLYDCLATACGSEEGLTSILRDHFDKPGAAETQVYKGMEVGYLMKVRSALQAIEVTEPKQAALENTRNADAIKEMLRDKVLKSFSTHNPDARADKSTRTEQDKGFFLKEGIEVSDATAFTSAVSTALDRELLAYQVLHDVAARNYGTSREKDTRLRNKAGYALADTLIEKVSLANQEDITNELQKKVKHPMIAALTLDYKSLNAAAKGIEDKYSTVSRGGHG